MRLTATTLVLTVAVLLTACGSQTVEVQATEDPLVCETQREEVVSLMRSGQPTYDYDPFPTTASLIDGSDAVVFGTIGSLSRKVLAEDGLTIAAVSGVDVMYPADMTRDIESLAWSSWWADSSAPDPLAQIRQIHGVEFVAFLTASPAAPGGFIPHIQGLSVACVGSSDQPTPIQESLPADALDKSFDELRQFVDELVAGEAATANSPLDGPVMRHPERSENAEGVAAEIFGQLEVEGECLYLAMGEPAQRFPVIWPAGTRWDAARQVLITPNGDQIGLIDEAYGGGGYSYLDSVKRLLGRDAHALAERCVDNEFGEIAIVNNHDDAIGRRES